MTEKSSELNVKELFDIIPKPSKELLIGMVNASEFGLKKPAIKATSNLKDEKLDSSMQQLQDLGLMQSGKVTGEPRHQEFIVGEGERFRLTPGVREQVFKDILKMTPPTTPFDKS